MLSNAAEYFFRSGVQGKRLRATVMLLLASALRAPEAQGQGSVSDAEAASEQLGKQKGVAEIAEMIHVASLLHDDVLDNAATRRGMCAPLASPCVAPRGRAVCNRGGQEGVRSTRVGPGDIESDESSPCRPAIVPPLFCGGSGR
jgi:hypothetical protein